MTRVVVNTEFSENEELRSGDIILFEDDSQWVVIRLENDYMLYNLGSHRYVYIPKEAIVSAYKAGEEMDHLPLAMANERLSSRYGADRKMQSRIIKADKVLLTITELR